MKKYKIKKTKKLIKKLRLYWKELQKIENKHRGAIYKLEKQMEKDTGIKGIKFYYCDNECVGICL